MKNYFLLLCIFLFSIVSAEAQLAISGPSSSYPDQTCTYSVVGADIGKGVPLWDIKNGVFTSGSGGLTVNVKWNSNATSGTIGVSAYPMTGSYQRASKTVAIRSVFENTSVFSSTSLLAENSTVSYSVNNYPAGTTFNWTTVQNLTLVSGQGTANAVFRGTGSGEGIAKVQLVAGSSSVIKQASVWFGRPRTPYFVSSLGLSGNNCYNIPQNTVIDLTYDEYTATNCTWEIKQGAAKLTLTGLSVSFRTRPLDPDARLAYTISVTAHNAYGSSDSGVFNGYVVGVNWPLTRAGESSLFESSSIENLTGDVELRVFNLSGILVYSSKLVNQPLDIKSLNLDNGLYIVEAIDKEGNVKREKIVINNNQ